MIVSKFGKEEVNKKRLLVLAAFFILTTSIVVFTQYQGEVFGNTYEYYPTIFIVYSVIACCFFLNLFKLIEKDDNKVQNGLIKFFEPNTYLIFLWHIFFINLSQYDWMPIAQNKPKMVFLGASLITITGILLLCLIMNLSRKLIKRNGG